MNEDIINNFNEKLNECFARIEALEQEKKSKTSHLYESISSIEKVINTQLFECKNEINSIKNYYSNFAHDLAIADGKCPSSRWGGYLDFDEARINDKGINLIYDSDNEYDCDCFFASWKDLMAYEAKQLLVKIIEPNKKEVK